MNRSTEPATPETEDMLTAPAPAGYNKNVSTAMPKSMVPDPEWFDRDRTKFEDWWKEIRLFFKSNRVVAADDKITTVLAQFRESVAEIYVQRKIDKLEETEDTQDWEEGNQDSIQWQEQSSRHKMKDQNILTRQETHCWFHDWI